MECNKDEAARSLEIAKSALASGDKPRALKLIRIARRLNPSLPLDAFLADCEAKGKIRREKVETSEFRKQPSCTSKPGDGAQKYREDHVRLIRKLGLVKDYYEILGVAKNSSFEEIRRAYRKMSLKVHPDKNKAPGAADAFRSVYSAFKCLSDVQSRQNYDKRAAAKGLQRGMPNVSASRRKSTMRDHFHDRDSKEQNVQRREGCDEGAIAWVCFTMFIVWLGFTGVKCYMVIGKKYGSEYNVYNNFL